MSNYNDAIIQLDDEFKNICHRFMLNSFDYLDIFDDAILLLEEGKSWIEIRSFLTSSLEPFYEEDEFEELYEEEEKPLYKFNLYEEEW